METDEVDLDERESTLREVEDTVAGGERVGRSVEALKALKPDEARALLLKAEGLSYDEIGRQFGWSYTKVNRSIAEGRKRFLKVYRGIESGEACERYEPVLDALAGGTATSAQVLSIRPHLRHCAACRATVRSMRFSRTRRIALLGPFAWISRVLSRARRGPADVERRRALRAGRGARRAVPDRRGRGRGVRDDRRAPGGAADRPPRGEARADAGQAQGEEEGPDRRHREADGQVHAGAAAAGVRGDGDADADVHARRPKAKATRKAQAGRPQEEARRRRVRHRGRHAGDRAGDRPAPSRPRPTWAAAAARRRTRSGGGGGASSKASSGEFGIEGG